MTSVKELLIRQEDALQESYEYGVLILTKSNIGGKIIRQESKNVFKEFEE